MKACVSACHFQILIRSYVQMGQGAVQWEQTLKSCREGEGSAEKLQVLCTDLQKSVRLWLDLRLAQLPVSPTVLSHAIRAVQVCKPCLTLLMPPTSMSLLLTQKLEQIIAAERTGIFCRSDGFSKNPANECCAFA